MGESPLNTLDDDHPLVPAARSALMIMNQREQAKSWWFNKELVTLEPEASGAAAGNIYTPADAIRVDPTDTTLNLVQRGRRLYRPYAPAAADKYNFDGPVTCWLVRLLPFEDLPPTAQELVRCATLLDFQKDYDADEAKFNKLTLEYKQALINLNAEHIRNVNANLLRRQSVRQSMRQITPTPTAIRR